ncbi:MAG: sugar ABC transporter substrate-binding protein, partial [Pseudonocardia sp.]
MTITRWKTAVVTGLLTAGLLLSTACGTTTGESAASGNRIAFMGLAAQNTYTQSTYEAAKAVVEEEGGTLTYFDGQFKSDVQYNQMLDIATSKRFDAVLVMANDGASIAPAVTRAIEAGIKVIAVEFPIGPDPTNLEPQIDGIVATVGYDSHAESVTHAQRIVDLCQDEDPCNVAWMMGDRTTLFDKIRWDAITATVAEHPNVRIVSSIDMHWSRTEGLAAGRTILTANSADLHIITGPDIGLMGATDALRAAGKLGQYTLVGFGTTVDGVAQVRNGTWDSSCGVHAPADEGRLAGQMIMDALAGEAVRP